VQRWVSFVRFPGRARTRPGSLCRTFQAASARTQAWLTEARPPDLVPDETSITDLHLFEIWRAHPNQVAVRRFKPHEEAREGADWEWWLGGKDGWRGLRVQAKKLDRDGYGYPELLAKAGSTTRRQIDLLIERAAAASPAVPAAYCFYNGRPAARTVVKTCQRQTTLLPGCTIAAAELVRLLVNDGSTGCGTVAAVSRPWSDLVCCGSGGTIAESVASTLEALGMPIDGPAFDHLPEHVSFALEGNPEPAHARGLAGFLVIREMDDAA
jgi:hypothetical protein